MINTDFLVIGGGIVGLSIACELQQRYKDASITLIDKEAALAMHASGRNSGVLHSGIYYTANSLKARFTRDGNLAWQKYCDEHNLRIERCGKLVVARNEADIDGLKTLEQRGAANGVEVVKLDKAEITEFEPRIKTTEYGLFIPSTATIDPVELVAAKQRQFMTNGGSILFGHPYLEKRPGGNVIRAGQQLIEAAYVVNAAGLYADRVAHDFGFGERYSVIPFKGLYLYGSNTTASPRLHIYPVPDLKNPFLGVHFTRTLDGVTKIGPTAMPAFWRENYSGFKNFSLTEFINIALHEANMFARDINGFRSLAFHELKKQFKSTMVKDAAQLMAGVDELRFEKWGKPGIRAQLLDREAKKLEMDFVVEGDERSMHVLNAVSPAFTCAIPFAEYVVDQIEQRTR